MVDRIVCALDTGELDSALATIRRLAPRITKFKIGHALTLAHGLEVIGRLQDAGADEIFLDLKFHDIPNSVAIAVEEASRRDVWMLTVHLTGGSAMLRAAREAAGDHCIVIGVGVLTSLDDESLRQVGVANSVGDQMLRLGELAIAADLDGMVCSPREIVMMRGLLGPDRMVVVPGIRLAGEQSHDQLRTGDPATALRDGASFLVMGRALTESDDPQRLLDRLAVSWDSPKTS